MVRTSHLLGSLRPRSRSLCMAAIGASAALAGMLLLLAPAEPGGTFIRERETTTHTTRGLAAAAPPLLIPTASGKGGIAARLVQGDAARCALKPTVGPHHGNGAGAPRATTGAGSAGASSLAAIEYAAHNDGHYEVCLRGAGETPGPAAHYGLCLPVTLESDGGGGNTVMATLPSLPELDANANANAAGQEYELELTEVWSARNHDGFDEVWWSDGESNLALSSNVCHPYWVDEVRCLWALNVEAETGSTSSGDGAIAASASATAEPQPQPYLQHPPIPQSFFDKYDSVLCVGDSTMRGFYDAISNRCRDSLDPEKAIAGDNTFTRTGKLKEGIKSVESDCGGIVYVKSLGIHPTQDPGLGDTMRAIHGNLIEASALDRTLVLFNIGHTYVNYNETQFAPRAGDLADALSTHRFPNLVFLHNAAMTPRKWNPGKCSHNNILTLRRNQDTIAALERSGVTAPSLPPAGPGTAPLLPIINVFYESMAARDGCAVDGVHYCSYVYNLMVDKLLEITEQTAQEASAESILAQSR